jgi:hypothetical protein
MVAGPGVPPERLRWTLGRREGIDCWYCLYCGRNCVADRVPFVVLDLPKDGGLRFACVCCSSGQCIHVKPIVVECHKCRRPVARISFGGGRVGLIGSIRPEGDLHSGSRTVAGFLDADGRYKRAERSSEWTSRVWDVSQGGPAWENENARGNERYKLVCAGKRHRIEKLTTRRSLQNAYTEACRKGVRRISLRDL